jgi:DNA-binding NtrC family response regulator
MPKKILLVDDEPSFRKEIRKFLEAKGYAVVEAHSGEEALEVYREEKPNVVLLDMVMPGMSGLVTLRELKALDPEASVIMVTVVREEELANQAITEGAFDYITKPVNREYLEMALMTKIALLGLEGD